MLRKYLIYFLIFYLYLKEHLSPNVHGCYIAKIFIFLCVSIYLFCREFDGQIFWQVVQEIWIWAATTWLFCDCWIMLLQKLPSVIFLQVANHQCSDMINNQFCRNCISWKYSFGFWMQALSNIWHNKPNGHLTWKEIYMTFADIQTNRQQLRVKMVNV